MSLSRIQKSNWHLFASTVPEKWVLFENAWDISGNVVDTGAPYSFYSFGKT